MDVTINTDPVTDQHTCVACGSWPAAMTRLQVVKGYVFGASHSEIDGPFCRDCGTAAFRQAQSRTLLLGWWSPMGLLMNTIAVVGNLRARRKFARLGPPLPGPDSTAGVSGPVQPGRSVWASPGAWVTIGAVTLAVGFVGVTVATSAQRGDDGEIVRRGTLSAFGLLEGDCFDMPDGEASVVDAVPCNEPHDAEVVALRDHPAAAGVAFPSEDERYEFVGDSCLPAFGAYVGTPYEESELDVAWLEPTADGWSQGDHTFVCAATTWDGSKLTGSVRGSGR